MLPWVLNSRWLTVRWLSHSSLWGGIIEPHCGENYKKRLKKQEWGHCYLQKPNWNLVNLLVLASIFSFPPWWSLLTTRLFLTIALRSLAPRLLDQFCPLVTNLEPANVISFYQSPSCPEIQRKKQQHTRDVCLFWKSKGFWIVDFWLGFCLQVCSERKLCFVTPLPMPLGS